MCIRNFISYCTDIDVVEHKLNVLGGGNMRFINQLNKYYDHLNDRLAKGFDYLVENPDDKRALELYNDIIEELSHVEELVNYYKNK